jgi:HEAT repeat protein
VYRRELLFLCCLLLVAVIEAASQGAGATPAPGFTTLSDALKRHNIDLSEASLVRALHNSDSDVRYLAAAKLAEDKKIDAIPAITDALESEKSPATRVNIAFALARFGNDEGMRALTAECENDDLVGHLRLRAAGYLLALQKEGCFDAVLKMASPGPNSEIQIQALTLLTRYSGLGSEDSKKIFTSITKSLSDQQPSVRLNASIALQALGDRSGISVLQNAISHEKDAVVKSQMQQSLKALQSHATEP